MNKKIFILIILFLVAGLGVFYVINYINKPVTDFAEQKVESTFNFNDIMNKVSNDTASLIELKDKLVAVSGNITQKKSDGEMTTIVIGDTNSMSTIICQVDKRYLSDFESKNEGDLITIKGIITGYTIDTELGLGNTVEMNYCTIQK